MPHKLRATRKKIEPKPAPFDWLNPNYDSIIKARLARLRQIRANPKGLPAVKAYYRDHIAEFISDWGWTADPRMAERNLPTSMPFVLFHRQTEWVEWLIARWRSQEPGIVEKSRESGMSWLAVATACSLCLFNRGMVIGFGSRKEEYVDLKSSPKSLFEKARTFLSQLPAEFLDGWTREQHSPNMRILFPGSGSAITGESGDGIGRGDRTSIYFVDESAFLERPQLVDASLSSTTNCRIDVSTPNGMANSFAQRRHSGRIKVFTFSWRDDPRKDAAWYAKQMAELDPVVLAQEVNIDYAASVENVVIPMPWAQSAIGACEKLGIKPSGVRRGALDLADEGRDLNAFAGRHGQRLEYLKSWSGKNKDIFLSVQMAAMCCDEQSYTTLLYDADGLGAGARGDLRIINEQRKQAGRRWLDDTPFRGSASPLPGEMVPGRRNEDFFSNLKAQSWWSMRAKFQATHRAIVEDKPYDPDEIISIDPELEELPQLLQELTQVTFTLNTSGKLLIDKQPAGFKSPNLADSVCMAFCPLNTSGGGFFPAQSSTVPAEEIELPLKCDAVFASTVAGVYPDRDAVAVVYFAATAKHDLCPPLVILDWSLEQITGGLMETWLANVYRTLDKLTADTRARYGSAGLVIEPGGFGGTIFNATMHRNLPASLVDEITAAMPLAERGVGAAPFVRSGAVVFARTARERLVNFKGTMRNHLIAQSAAFAAGDAEQPGAELLASFVNGTLEAFRSADMQGRVDGSTAAGAYPELGGAAVMTRAVV